MTFPTRKLKKGGTRLKTLGTSSLDMSPEMVEP